MVIQTTVILTMVVKRWIPNDPGHGQNAMVAHDDHAE
jgi:hypothetical protein